MKTVLLLIALLIAGSITAGAQIPRVIGYQGVLLEKNNRPKPNNTYRFKFEFYDAANTQLWASDEVSLEVHNGVFSAALGVSPGPAISDTLLFDRQYFLQITVEGEVMQQRIPLTTVGYAFSAGNGVPVGTIQAFAGEDTTGLFAQGWMLCDGSTYVPAAFPQLKRVLKDAWGIDSLPDLRGLFLRGAGDPTGANDPDVNRAVGSVQLDQIQSHKHDDTKGHFHSGQTSTDGAHTHGYHRASIVYEYVYSTDDGNQSASWERHDDPETTESGAHDHTFSTSNEFVEVGDPTDSGSGSGDPRHGTETRPKNAAVRYIIKVR